jgi:hypothetical protein
MSKKNNNLTRQGVRNLDRLTSKPRGIRLPIPPHMLAEICTHQQVRVDHEGDAFCAKCGMPLF